MPLFNNVMRVPDVLPIPLLAPLMVPELFSNRIVLLVVLRRPTLPEEMAPVLTRLLIVEPWELLSP